VIGGARSGLAVAALLKNHGAQVFLSEKAPSNSMVSVRAELEQMGISSEFGGNTERVLDADTIVVSPGVPSDVPIVKQARARGIPLVSELEVAAWFCDGPIVAITGTNGKTTTTSLTGRMFEDARLPSVVAGNIGTAFSDAVGKMPSGGTAILEVSSFQLDYIVSFRPRVAVLLNVTPDHLDRYEHSFEKYTASKRRIFENQNDGDALVYNVDDPVTRSQVEYAPRAIQRLPFSVRSQLPQGAFLDRGTMVAVVKGERSELLPPEEMSLRGIHNLANAMAATLAARFMGVRASSIRATLRNFRGVEHRLEFVRERNGVWFVNDSKATNVDSVWYALQSYTQPIIVIIGGRDKGNDYSRLYELVQKRVKTVIAIGESAEKVVDAFSKLAPVARATSMEEAVEMGAAMAAPGDVVLLSPACASFDWFQNYEHRGRMFKDAVMKLSDTSR